MTCRFLRPVGLLWVALLACALTCGEAEGEEVSSMDDQNVPSPHEVLSAADMDAFVPHHPGGEWPKDWVNTPLGPRVIRRGEDAKTATYHEVTGYTFLVNSMKRPRLVRLDNGRLVMLATAWLHRTGQEEVIILTSDDEGRSWSQPREVSFYGQLVALGGAKVGCLGEVTTLSDDGGETWSEPIRHPLPDGTPLYHHGTVAFDGRRVAAVGYYEGAARPPVGWSAYSMLRLSDDLGRTWGEPIPLPVEWQTSEGALTYARDGALVVALRTGPKATTLEALSGDREDHLVGYNDHWRRITTARSSDDGKTWTDHQVHFRFGKTHSELLTLPDGNILLTYAARIGELDGLPYHGIEAVLSRDDGRTWDWANRYFLFRWDMMASMHSPQSILLSDGRIMTVFLYHYDAPWGKRLIPAALNIGMVDAVFWRAE